MKNLLGMRETVMRDITFVKAISLYVGKDLQIQK